MGLLDIFGGGGGNSGIDTSSKATTTSTDQKTAASEGSLAVGPGGKFLEGLDLAGASNVTITSDAAANQTIADLSQGLTSYLQTSNASALASQKTANDLLKEVLTKLSEKETREQTGFQSLLISPLFWLGIAGLVVLGIFLWRKA